MGLAEMVRYLLPNANYYAQECVDSRRQRFIYRGVAYCMLSGGEEMTYCPLQAKKKDGCHFSVCLREDYLRELEGKKKRS